MATKTLLVLDQLLLEAISDYISVATTTNITTDNFIISTKLNAFDFSRDGYFDTWWVYLNTSNNTTVDRRIRDYDTSTGRLDIYGDALSSESGATTIRLSHYSRANRDLAIKRAIEEIYPNLHLKLENRELVTGNILIPFNWASSTSLEKWSTITSTIAKTTTGDNIRGGETSAKITASSAGGSIVLSSDDYPRLLDLMGKTVTAKVWASPEVANDAQIRLTTLKTDGTAQILTSTTTCPDGEFTLLELKDQDLDDDVVQITCSLRVQTDTKFAYFSMPRLTGRNLYEYILPLDFQKGSVETVDIQVSGYSEDICDDLRPLNWQAVHGWELIEDGTDKWLRLPYLYSSKRQIRLKGRKRLEDLSSDTDTITLDRDERVNLLIALAAHKLFKIVKGLPAGRDIGRVDDLINEWEREYFKLLRGMRMNSGSIRMNLPAL